MNYCILNGVRSTSIKGLLIQSLPMISKPLIRTEIEEIDGRDGDIVTPLGYSAYDKEMTIGLFGNYKIDDVISFFDSQGTVTFSNEPDKYYIYQIIEQIDFERLIRFKSATVIFHVQPFKYSAVGKTVSFTGLGNMVDASQANILDAYFDTSVTSITEQASSRMLYVPCEPNTTYTISKMETAIFNVGYTNSVPRIGTDVYGVVGKDQVIDGRDVVTITTGAFAEYIVMRYYASSSVTEQEVLESIKIQLGSEMILNSISVTNLGNVKSKPLMTIYGSGTVNLSLNGTQVFVLVINSGYITIDVAQMQAYLGDTFMNRYVYGDYDNLMLNVGKNTLSWTGDVTQIELERYSRWI